MEGRAYFRSDVVEVYVEGRVAWDVEEVARAVGRGEVAVGVFTFDFSPWEGVAVRRRERWPGALFVVGRPTSPVFSRPARCRVEHLGGSGGFLGAAAAAKEALARGEVFQLVLARFEKYLVECPIDAVYRALAEASEGRYHFFFEAGEVALAGVSPEVLAKVEGRRVLSGPIGGTRPRGRTADEDRALEEELVSSVKERAEHIMLVDSVRNDLGRVCAWGSVRPVEVLKVEKYSYVQHLVSYVEGVLDRFYRPIDAVLALNPTTTVVGVPKPRAMSLIDMLEEEPRGPFAGSFGVLAKDFADFAVVIRSVYGEGDTFYVWAGAGIVADSDPAWELRETEVKMAPAKDALRRLGSSPPP